MSQGPITEDYAARFVATYHEFPPGVEHDTLIICNGGPLSVDKTLLFDSLNPMMLLRENDPGWDISGYIDAARVPCSGYDAVLFLGESNYFHRAGWFKRLVDAWNKWGPGMYGPYSSNAIRSHLNTTAFFCSPGLVASYNAKVCDRKSRYEFEHGPSALWRKAEAQTLSVRLVTWDNEWEPRAWRMPRDILWRGNQSNCLMWCNHSDNYANADSRTKSFWQRYADAPFK